MDLPNIFKMQSIPNYKSMYNKDLHGRLVAKQTNSLPQNYLLSDGGASAGEDPHR